jgi:hypothetical protein
VALMSRTLRPCAILLLTLALAPAAAAQKKPRKDLAVDFDMNHIAEPKERKDAQYYDFFDSSLFEQVQQLGDLPRHFHKKPAANVNAREEVPDSSWFTNRNGKHPLTLEEVRQGPNRGAGPDTRGAWTIVGRKPSGVAPGFRIRDAAGTLYIVKFDLAAFDELATGAEVVTSKLYYAAGYNTSEVYIVNVSPAILKVGEGARIVDARGLERPMRQQDLDEIMAKVRRRPDGTVRAIAKKFLAGKPKGSFAFVGLRKDDPNDWIPHEHRRDLRGLRILASWVNDNDIRERNTLDMYVSEGGRSFLRHYLIDPGSALGSETLFSNTDRVGFEYILDWGEVGKSMFALGLYEPWWLGYTKVVYPSIGYFEAGTFEPQRWKANYPIVAFENMTLADAYWGAKLVLSFRDEQIRAVVESAEYGDPRAAEYLINVLRERRDRIGRYWYKQAGGLENFRATPAPSASLRFDDLLIAHGFAEPAERSYRYRVAGAKGWREQSARDSAGVPLAGISGKSAQIEIAARNAGDADWSAPVTVFLARDGTGWQVTGWSRD